MAEEASKKIAEDNSGEILSKFNSLDEKYEHLRRVSARVVVEYEDLQQKCEENFKKLNDERSKYLQVKEDLEKLKQVSSLALEEYENLHRKYEVEQDCRNNAEKYATKVVKQNKELKRKSQMIIAKFGNLETFQFPEDLLNGEQDESLNEQQDEQSALSKEVLESQINEMKVSLEDTKKELKDALDKLATKEEEFVLERQKCEMLNKKLTASEKEYRQLNRVSVLAFEEYNKLQQKYEVESQCRSEAEKFAAEVLKETKSATRGDDVSDETTPSDAKLSKALKEIEELTKNLEHEKTLVKELQQQLESASGSDYARDLSEVAEESHDLTKEQVEVLENCLKEANRRADEAEAKVAELERQLKKEQEDTIAERKAQNSEVVAAPPPPPPPPPPNQLIKKFMKIVGSNKKMSLKKTTAQAKDPRVEAMNEMMERIKSGKVQLRKTRALTDSDEKEAAPGMSELGSILKGLNRSHSGSLCPLSLPGVDESVSAWSNIKLKKTQPPRTSSQTSDSAESSELNKIILRKPRSRSTGDLLDHSSSDSATAELKQILQKKRAAAEPDVMSNEPPSSPKDIDLSDKCGESEIGEEPMDCAKNQDEFTENLVPIEEVRIEEDPAEETKDSVPSSLIENSASSGDN